jgi:hypothetical protein
MQNYLFGVSLKKGGPSKADLLTVAILVMLLSLCDEGFPNWQIGKKIVKESWEEHVKAVSNVGKISK